jgi:hypothetical protein
VLDGLITPLWLPLQSLEEVCNWIRTLSGTKCSWNYCKVLHFLEIKLFRENSEASTCSVNMNFSRLVLWNALTGLWTRANSTEALVLYSVRSCRKELNERCSHLFACRLILTLQRHSAHYKLRGYAPWSYIEINYFETTEIGRYNGHVNCGQT